MEHTSIDTTFKEWVLLKENVIRCSSKYHSKTGTLALTSNGITFKKDVSAFVGILRKLFSGKPGTDLRHSIPFKKIKTVSNTFLGLNKNILVISTTDNKTIKFSVRDYNQWKDTILDLIIKSRTHSRNQY